MTARGSIARGASDRLALHLRAMSIVKWAPLPHQVPPPGNWRGWLLLAGRGAGKTDACAKYITDHVNGPPCLPGGTPHWIGIIAPTLGDAATSCVNGPSGLKAHNPDAKMTSGPGGLSVRWPNGSEAKLFGAHTPEDVERLRSGGNRCVVWAEELAAWRYLDACWPHMRFGLRVGQRPHWVASTTPKPRPLIKKLDKGLVTNVAISRASMYDNPHLDEELRQELEDEYGDTQLGRQELHAEIMDQDESALWTHAMLDASRVQTTDSMPPNSRRSVGVDPSGGMGEQGIVVVGKSMVVRDSGEARRRVPLAHGFVLADRTCHLTPDGWGRRAVQAAVDYEADDICVEVNYGGDMAIGTIRSAADSMGIAIPVRKVTASRGKKVRASPVSALTEQNRWHLVGVHSELEDQLCVVAGTLVETARGHVPVEQVRRGDLAMTRDGWAPVQWAGQTGTAARLIGVHVLGCALWMTPSHPVYLPELDQFVPARNVQPGQLLDVRRSPASSALPWRGVATGGTWRHTGTTGIPGDSCCTELSTKRITGRCPRGCSCTTETRTSGTTSTGILSSGLRSSTSLIMAGSGGPSQTAAPYGVPGVSESGRSGNPGQSCVTAAVLSSSPLANGHGIARSVAEMRLGTAVPVFNLMISDGYLPEFYANGVLVHNCTWHEELDWSPDRLDAMVWPAWHQRIVKLTMTGTTGGGGKGLAAATQTIG